MLQPCERNGVVERHLYLVRPVAARLIRFLPTSFTQDDLEQWGALGLIRAAADADQARNWPAFARCLIRRAMIDGVRRQRALAALPDDLPGRSIDQTAAISLRVAMARLPRLQRRAIEARYLRELTLDQAAAELGLSRRRIQQLEAEAIEALRAA